MFKKRNFKAFTLIEIIVVLVILGILATIALSSMFSWIEKSRSAELVPVLKGLADQVDACVLSNGFSTTNFQNCINAVNISSNNTSNFKLVLTENSSGNGGKWGYALFYKNRTVQSYFINYPSCPELTDFSGLSERSYGIIVICSYPQDGTNQSAYAGQRMLIGAGGYQGMF